MNKQFLNVATRLALLCTLLATFAVIGVVPAADSATWTDAAYFNALHSCDPTYHGTLDNCRANPSYPINPDENQCRYNAGNSYFGCVLAIPAPAFEMDFCAGAMAARDNCVLQYGLEGIEPDFGAYSECINASGIGMCQ